MAAVAVAGMAVLGGLLVAQDHRMASLEAQLHGQARTNGVVLALANPASIQVRITSPSGGLRMLAVITPGGVGYAYAGSLPRLDPDRTYQLWAIRAQGASSLGVLGPDPNRARFRVPVGTSALAITDEAHGGARGPHGAPVASGALVG